MADLTDEELVRMAKQAGFNSLDVRCHYAQLRAFGEAYAKQAATKAALPEGWVSVPREPTRTMIERMCGDTLTERKRKFVTRHYRSMVRELIAASQIERGECEPR